MRKVILLILSVIVALVISAQTPEKIQQWKDIAAKGKKDTITLIALDSLFNIYAKTLDNDSVFYYAKKIFDLAGELHNNKLQWNVAGRRLSERYFEQGKIDSSLQLLFKGLSFFEDIKDSVNIDFIYTTIGNAHKEYGDYRKAIYYYLKSYTIARLKQYDYGIYASSGNLGFAYAQVNQLDSALYYANISYEYALKPNTKGEALFSEFNLGIVHNKLGNYAVAKDFFQSAFRKINKTNRNSRFSQRLIANLYLGLAKSSVGLNEHDSTLFYAKFALIVSTKMQYLKGIVDAQKLLAESFYSLHQIDSAYYYRRLYDIVKDSLYNRDKSSVIASITFEQNQIEQKRQAELSQQAEDRKHNIQLAFIAIGILSASIIFLLLSNSFIVSHKVVGFLSVLVLLVVFEFINLLLHPFLERITHHSPILMLLGLVAIAALIIPLHHRLEHWATYKLVEKNKAIRLAQAKKTIEELEGNKNA